MQTLCSIAFEIGITAYGLAKRGRNLGRWPEVWSSPLHKLVACLLNLPTVNRLYSSVAPYHHHHHHQQQQQRSPTTYEPSFTDSEPVKDSEPPNDPQRPPYEPLLTEPLLTEPVREPSLLQDYGRHWFLLLQSKPTVDSSTRSYWTFFPFTLLSLSSFSFCGIRSSRRDSATENDLENDPEGTSSLTWAVTGETSQKKG